jgi:PIN domain nuclease of toxin-antitoxin system
MIILDTCILIFDALDPARLTKKAEKSLIEAEIQNRLYCSDISLWEIAMLVSKNRLDIGTDYLTFMNFVLKARSVKVLPITPEIADLSFSLPLSHHDPADRIIAATSVFNKAFLITCDEKLIESDIPTIW